MTLVVLTGSQTGYHGDMWALQVVGFGISLRLHSKDSTIRVLFPQTEFTFPWVLLCNRPYKATIKTRHAQAMHSGATAGS